MTTWTCNRCASCCKLVGPTVAAALEALDKGEADPVVREVAEFPHPINPDGACSMLNDNTCSIYDKRPPICNNGVMYDRYWSEVVTHEVWQDRLTKACEELNKHDDITEGKQNKRWKM